jgi:hypothetical protein
MVRVLGDLSGLNKSFTDASSRGQKAAEAIHKGFAGTLTALNKTGVLGPFAEALDGVDQAIETIGTHAKQIGPAMIGVGGALAGIGVGLAALGSKDQAAHQQLQASVEATGKSYEDYSAQVEEAIKHQERFGTTANETQDALRVLTQATGDPTKALNLLNTASDLAAAKHESLATAAGQLGKAYNGSGRILKEFGITGVKGAAAMTELSTKLSGQAAASADTFGGHINAIKAHLDDVVAVFGQKYGPAITGAGSALAGLGGAVTVANGFMQVFKKTQQETAAATEALTAATEAQTAATEGLAVAEETADAAALPLLATIGLVVLAIAALGVAAYVIYRNWDTIWKAMKLAVEVVWRWIKSNWPYLTAILLGPIALAAAAIYKHWQSILGGLQAVWRWIRSTWSTVYNDIVAPIGRAIGAIVGWFTGLPGRIAGLTVHMFDGIANAFVDAINFIIGVWNGLQFKVPGVSVFGHHFGGFTLGLPDIPKVPHLDQGGLITSTGLVLAHAGEVITPAPAASRTGPAIVFNGDNHFSSDVDIELFMRRAAWQIQTQKL